MNYKIISFQPHKTALIISIILAVISFISILLLGLGITAFPPTDQYGNSVNFHFPFYMLFMGPLLYFVFGYIFVVISCLLYNKISKNIGGITINAERTDSN